MSRPPVGAYDPLVSVGRPGGKPNTAPKFRVLLHKRDWKNWEQMVDTAGLQNAQQLWDHLALRADQPPLLGTVTRLRGKHMQGKDGWSAVHHYEITGAGRVDYQFHPRYTDGARGDAHAIVKIIRISMSSH